MKLWRKLLLGLMGLIAVVILVGWLLPAKQHIEHSIVVRGKPEEVFNLVATLKRWPDWTAWTTNRFPDMTLRFEGAESRVGAAMVRGFRVGRQLSHKTIVERQGIEGDDGWLGIHWRWVRYPGACSGDLYGLPAAG